MTVAAQAGTLSCPVWTRMPTRYAVFQVYGFEREISSDRVEIALAIVLGDPTEGVPLRVHSQCFTGEVLGSLRCDCNDQLEMAMRAIAEEGRGLIIYEYQEGRGIGLMAKLQVYGLQDAGLDTVEANHALGFKADCGDFSLPAAILGYLGIGRVRLLRNNPRKTQALAECRHRRCRSGSLRSLANAVFLLISADKRTKIGTLTEPPMARSKVFRQTLTRDIKAPKPR